MGNSIKEIIKMKIEIDLPEEIYLFFKSRSIYHKNTINQEIINYLKNEFEISKELSFEDVMEL